MTELELHKKLFSIVSKKSSRANINEEIKELSTHPGFNINVKINNKFIVSHNNENQLFYYNKPTPIIIAAARNLDTLKILLDDYEPSLTLLDDEKHNVFHASLDNKDETTFEYVFNYLKKNLPNEYFVKLLNQKTNYTRSYSSRKESDTPLTLAIRNKNFKAVELILNEGVILNNTPYIVFDLIQNNNIEMAKYLFIEQYIDIKPFYHILKEKSYPSPLEYLVKQDKDIIKSFLPVLTNGIDTNNSDGYNFNMVEHIFNILTSSNPTAQKEILNYLIKNNKVDVDKINNETLFINNTVVPYYIFQNLGNQREPEKVFKRLNKMGIHFNLSTNPDYQLIYIKAFNHHNPYSKKNYKQLINTFSYFHDTLKVPFHTHESMSLVIQNKYNTNTSRLLQSLVDHLPESYELINYVFNKGYDPTFYDNAQTTDNSPLIYFFYKIEEFRETALSKKSYDESEMKILDTLKVKAIENSSNIQTKVSKCLFDFDFDFFNKYVKNKIDRIEFISFLFYELSSFPSHYQKSNASLYLNDVFERLFTLNITKEELEKGFDRLKEKEPLYQEEASRIYTTKPLDISSENYIATSILIEKLILKNAMRDNNTETSDIKKIKRL